MPGRCSEKVPCGVLIKDSAEGVECAVGEILKNRDLYKKEDIAKEFTRFEWDNVFDVYLGDVLMLPKSREIA